MHEQIHNEFLHDAEELIERLFRDLEELRAAYVHDRRRRELVAGIFRYVHTIKGSAASHWADPVSLIAHEFENVLDAVRLGQLTLDQKIIDAFGFTAAAMSKALDPNDRKHGEADYLKVIDRLRAIVPKSGRPAARLDVRSLLPEEIARALSEYDEQHLRETIVEGLRVFVVSAAFEIETFDEKFRALSEKLNQTGEVISTVPALEPAASGEINFRLLYAAEFLNDETFADASQLGRVQFSEVVTDVQRDDSEERTSIPPRLGAYAASGHRRTTTTVRVSLEQLDEIISQTGEVLRDTASAFDSLARETNRQTIESAGLHLRRRLMEIEQRLIKLRLVPLGQIFERAAIRAGRIAAHDLGKDIEFEISGGELSIDRALADVITDPLMHLVRNAVSHGIETPEKRMSTSKTAKGSVKIGAFAEGGRIHIRVADDGSGIDPDRISRVAAETGIIPPESSVTLDECLRLIFRPGFSTAESLSSVSGRGIGLEVVDRAMGLAGGEVRVTTERGASTAFEMIVPAILSLIHCIIVRAGSQRYCVDSSRVADRGAVEPRRIARGKTITWKGEELAMVNLRTLLGQSIDGDDGKATGLIIVSTSAPQFSSGKGNDRVAVLVDQIEAEQEVLLRSLGRHSASWRGVGGGAELLDGSIALVLDLKQLLERQSV